MWSLEERRRARRPFGLVSIATFSLSLRVERTGVS